MTQMTHDDLSRSLGWVEGELSSMKDRLDTAFDRFDTKLTLIESRLGNIEKAEAERKGAIRLAVWLAGMFGAALSWLVAHFIK